MAGKAPWFGNTVSRISHSEHEGPELSGPSSSLRGTPWGENNRNNNNNNRNMFIALPHANRPFWQHKSCEKLS